jgi:hypothetical protein
MRRVLWIVILALILLVGVASWLRLRISPLSVSASHSTLHMGETVQLSVVRKTWLGHQPLAHPEKTHYATTFESMAVVEPDGKVTAVGTWGKPKESAMVTAINGQLRGTVSFSLLAEGPGPTLDFVVEAPSVQEMRVATCCSTPAQLIEGQQIRYRLLRRNAEHTDVTRRSSGTRYTLFFGSGVPNDANAAQIVGYGEGINPATFRIDDEHGMIVVPTSIGRLNHFTVLAFARNGEAVGWKQFQLVHAAGGDSQ